MDSSRESKCPYVRWPSPPVARGGGCPARRSWLSTNPVVEHDVGQLWSANRRALVFQAFSESWDAGFGNTSRHAPHGGWPLSVCSLARAPSVFSPVATPYTPASPNKPSEGHPLITTAPSLMALPRSIRPRSNGLHRKRPTSVALVPLAPTARSRWSLASLLPLGAWYPPARYDGGDRGSWRSQVALPVEYELLLPQIAVLADAGSGIDLITRALGISADVVRDALHLHRTGEHPPKRVDPRRGRHRHKADPAWVPTYKQIAAEVDRRRKAGESFDQLARAMGHGRGTIVRAYDFANRAEALAAAREGRTPDRPAWRGRGDRPTAGRTAPT